MDLRPEALTWTGLLTQWVNFAQASLAIPVEADGPRWRASVPAIINLQAVTFALGDLDRLPRDEQALAIDKAELIIKFAKRELSEIWNTGGPGPMIAEIMEDASLALHARQQGIRYSEGFQRVTLLAASIAVDDPDEVEPSLKRTADSVKPGARLVEWRIDGLLEHADAMAAAMKLVKASPVPCIVTCRAAWEGGEYRGDEITRAQFLETLLKADIRPRYIDVELAAFERDPRAWKGFRNLLENPPAGRDLNTGLILSSHDFNGRPADLLQRIEKMANDPLCAIVKVAWHARSLRDNLEAFDLLRDRHKPTIALCMGQFGLLSRVLAPKFGGFLTFGVDQEEQITAPGQPTIDDLLNLYRVDRITPQTRVFGVIGWPVGHSMSPAIHNAGFAKIGFDGVYLPLPIPGGTTEYEHFKATVGAMIDHPHLNFRGASVTIPHKQNALRLVKERGGRIDPLAERIGAANTLIIGSAGGLECANTDCPAAIDSLCAGMGIDRAGLAGKRIAVIGAGGVARAIVAGLHESGAQVVLFSRTFDSAVRLASEYGSREITASTGSVAAASYNSMAGERFDVFINCTPIGMAGGPAPNDSPLPADVKLDDSMTVFDTVYAASAGSEKTPLIKDAEARGARAIPGIDMFLRQAALQFEKWTGVVAPVETFKNVLNERRT